MKIHQYGPYLGKPKGSWHILDWYASAEDAFELLDRLLKPKGWEIHQMDGDFYQICLKRRKTSQ
jgi:hypothetical protein